MPALSKEEVLMRLNSEKFHANLAAMAAAPEPEDETHKIQHAAAVEIASAVESVKTAKGPVGRFMAAKRLGGLLEAYANTYAQSPDTY